MSFVTDKIVSRAWTWWQDKKPQDITPENLREWLGFALTPERVDGKPSTFTEEACEAVMARLRSGDSLRRISRDPGMPSVDAFLGWVTVHGLNRQYAQARDVGIDARFDDLRELAATADQDNAAAIRVMVDVEKWALSKLKPGKYGDRLDLNVSGGLNVSALTDEGLNDRVEARLRAKLGPVFEEIEHPTLEDCLRVFRVTPLPVLLIAEDVTDG